MINNIIKLTKQQTNEVLRTIKQEEPRYALALTIQYIYGRNISEIYNLHSNDIDTANETITFTMNGDKLTYKVHPQIMKDLYDLTEENPGYIFQEGNKPPHTIKDGINYYLHKRGGLLNTIPYMRDLRLTTKAFKKLRGQHLYQDGIPLKTIHELYHNTNIEGTKKTIQYHELKELLYTQTLEDIIAKTNMEIYEEPEFNKNPIFYLTSMENEAILEITKKDDFKAIGDEELLDYITNEDFPKTELINKLQAVERVGDYIIFQNIKFIKN